MTAAPPPSRSRLPLILVAAACAVLLVLALAIGGVGVAGYLLVRADDGAATSSGPPAAPPGLPADATALHLGGDSSPRVDVYLDYACPHCAEFSRVNDEDLRMLAEDGTIDLRIHPLPMLNASSAGYSERAANAAACVWSQDPDLLWDMSSQLFAAQAEGPALQEEDLADMARELGAGEETLGCITEGTYLRWVNEVVGPEALEVIEGTPTVLIDGETWTGDHTVEDALLQAIVGE